MNRMYPNFKNTFVERQKEKWYNKHGYKKPIMTIWTVEVMFGGKIMDTFMDKLASKLNAQEMIRANSAAEAAENERLKKEVEVYKQCLQEMREISMQNTSTAVEVEELVKKSTEKIEAIQVEAAKSDDVLEVLKANQDELKKELKNQEENVHKECVKVYRNVQAVVSEENDKQTDEILESQRKLKKKATAALVMGILAMSFAALQVVLSILDILGVWDFLNIILF